MLFKLVGLLLCLAYAAGDDFVNAKPCANTTIYSRNVHMKVSGCVSRERCPLYRGTSHNVNFLFEPTRDFKNQTDSRVYGVFEKFSVPYGKKTDACSQSVTTDDDTACTATSGFVTDREYLYSTRFAVSNSYPMINLTVRFTFYDRRHKTVLLCMEVPVQITSSEENQV